MSLQDTSVKSSTYQDDQCHNFVICNFVKLSPKSV